MISLLQPITPRFIDSIREARRIGKLAMQNHLPTCGTQFRGCDPNCPKEIREQQEMADDKSAIDSLLGQKVMLKSGGPVMIVESVDDADIVMCQWWDGKEMARYGFDSRCLYQLVEFRVLSAK